jgi:predicted  nucleic acid-binding Zn-ribbon protein
MGLFSKLGRFVKVRRSINVKQLFLEISQDPELNKVAQNVMERIKREEPQRKATVKSMMEEIDRLSEQWNEEGEQYDREREEIIANFRAEEAAALANAKNRVQRRIVKQEYRKKMQDINDKLKERADKIDAILYEREAKKKSVSELLDPMTIHMLKERNTSWND